MYGNIVSKAQIYGEGGREYLEYYLIHADIERIMLPELTMVHVLDPHMNLDWSISFIV